MASGIRRQPDPIGPKWALAAEIGQEGKQRKNPGKANDECVRFFAELAHAPRARVRIVMGLTSRTKVVEIEGIAQDQLERLMAG